MGLAIDSTLRIVFASIFVFASVFVFTFQAAAQDDVPIENAELLVSLDVGYNTAMRDDHWTAVEVQVVNETEDRSGWVEIRTYDFSNTLQSPIYRLPGDFPQNSRKRFRFTCNLRNAFQVEAHLYNEKNRPLLDVPAYVQLQPIGEDDRLVMVLDDDPINFGFLYAAVQSGDKPVRLHRFNLRAPEFHRLPQHEAAYRAFDTIVIGDIDPSRMPPTQRALIHRFVVNGGNLVICTGIHAPAYTGTWVEALAGVSIGETTVITDRVLVEAAFAETPRLREGAGDKQDVVLATLNSPDDSILRLGDEQTLATRRTLGAGKVYTLAVDADSGALRTNAGYILFWQEALVRRGIAEDLNLDAVTSAAAQNLPHLAGVSIRSFQSVMLYLALYIGLGVIVNWIFWSRLKRREFAWLTLLVFSFFFTAYAVMSGSSGWSRTAQIHQLEVLHMRRHEGPAALHSLAGVFASRTTTFEAEITRPNGLVIDGSALDTQQYFRTGGFGAPRTVRPFRVNAGNPARIENLRVGASEIRLARIEQSIEVNGGIEGVIEFKDGGLRGSLQNTTDMDLGNAGILYRGALIPLTEDGPQSWTLDLDRAAVNERRTLNGAQTIWQPLYDGGGSQQLDAMRREILGTVFRDPSIPNVGIVDSDLSPKFFAWSRTPSELAITPASVLELGTAERLVVADITVDYPAASERERTPLDVVLSGTQMNPNVNWSGSRRIFIAQDGWIEPDVWMNAPGRIDIDISTSEQWLDDPSATLELYLFTEDHSSNAHTDGFDYFLAKSGTWSREWHEAHLVEDVTQKVRPRMTMVQRLTYTARDWRRTAWDEETETIRFSFIALPKGEINPDLTPEGRLDMSTIDLLRRPQIFFLVAGVVEYQAGFDPNEDILPWR